MNNPEFIAKAGELYKTWSLTEEEESDLREFVEHKWGKLLRKCLVYRASEKNEDLIESLDPADKGALEEIMSIIHFLDGYLPQEEDDQIEDEASELLG